MRVTSNRPTELVPLQILIADDNRDSADSLAMILQAEGHDAQTAYDGQAALNAALATRPQVAILDLGMPRLDGFFVAEAILRAAPQTLLIAVTGYGDAQNVARCRAAGFSHHLTKPIELQPLIDLLAAHRPA
jgi:CheY-like chemotaxis protein